MLGYGIPHQELHNIAKAGIARRTTSIQGSSFARRWIVKAIYAVTAFLLVLILASALSSSANAQSMIFDELQRAIGQLLGNIHISVEVSLRPTSSIGRT